MSNNFASLLTEGTHRIYFGHAGPMYSTKYEKQGMEAIKKQFPGYTIISPNDKKYDKLYQEKGFDIFFDIIDACDFSVFMAI